jgi:hypothetical protein
VAAAAEVEEDELCWTVGEALETGEYAGGGSEEVLIWPLDVELVTMLPLLLPVENGEVKRELALD